MSYGSVKLAIDDYNENREKETYVRELIKEYNDMVNSAADAGDDAGILGAFVTLVSGGDINDAVLAYNVGESVGEQYYLYDNNFQDFIDNADNPDFDIKFDKDKFQEDLFYNYTDQWGTNYKNMKQAAMWDVATSVMSYGFSGGFKPKSETWENMNLWEKTKYNVRDMFGLEADIMRPDNFENDKDYISYILNEMDNGKNIDEIISKKQQHALGIFGDRKSYFEQQFEK